MGKTTRPFRYDLNQTPYDYTVELRNRLKELDLIDRVPDELWMKVHDIVKETAINHPQEKEMQKGKMAVCGSLTNSCEKKRSEKQRRKIYPFECRLPKNSKTRRDKKAFLSDQRKEIEENNRMGKTRDPFKKIRDTKGIFHATMGTIKDINYMDLIEAEDIKKRWQEYTEKLYKNSLYNSDSHDGMITHLEPDILECKVKWASGSITMNKFHQGIPIELFQIQKHNSVKVLYSLCQQIWKTQLWPQDWKR